MKKIPALIILAFLAMPSYTQDETATSDTLRKDALNVYMEASSYLKERITFINYVRDRKVADLVVISTSEHTGSGGREFTMFLEGQGRYAGMNDTLKYTSSPDETYDQRREKEVKTFRLGLVRYIMKTPLANYLEVSFTEPLSSEVSTDKWNSWVFRANISGFANGQSTVKGLDIFGGISASRITEDWKIDIDFDYSKGKDTYEIGEEVIESNRISKSADALIVKSLNDHWSYGGSAEVLSSTYSNYDFKIRFMPGIEYDIFPYSESTRRQFRFLYSIGYDYNNYTDTTIYDMLEEGLFSHSLRSSYEVVQDWGTIDLSVSFSNYLRDFSQNELSIHGSIDWRVAKGLSIELGGQFAFIHNQISLVKGDITPEEILLRQTELKTDYSYFVFFGLSYTFGSIYNNVVNPRFGGSGGGMMIMF